MEQNGEVCEGDTQQCSNSTLLNRLKSKYLRQQEPRKGIRLQAWVIVSNVWFDRLVLFLILLNCIFLAIDDPTCGDECEKTSIKKKILKQAEYAFTVAFTIEMLLQITAKGMFFGKQAYFLSSWNWLDFVCVVTSIVALTGAGGNLSGLRAFRALRPLRTINAMPGMKLLVGTLIESVPLLLDVFILLTWVFFVFGIISLQLFMGAMKGRCHMPSQNGTFIPVDSLEDQVCSLPKNASKPYEGKFSGGFFLCSNVDPDLVCIEKQNPNDGFTSFDNFGWASLDNFHTLTLEGWTTDQMYHLLDGANAPKVVTYYIVIILFGSFFALNLLTAIISAKFGQLSESQDKHPKKEVESDFMVTLRSSVPASLKTSFKRLQTPQLLLTISQAAHNIVEDPRFDSLITGLIVINTLCMAMEYHSMPPTYEKTLEIIDIILTAGFIAEFLLKHVAYGILQYWRNWFNVLDGVVVLTSIPSMANVQALSGFQTLRTFRLLRIMRSMKLLNRFQSLRKLMKMVVRGFAALKDFMLLLALFIFIFSIIGMQMFGGQPSFQQMPGQPYLSNFDSFTESLYTVFEILTVSNWHVTMYAGMNARGPFASLYFILWIIIGNFVLLTLFLAILITNFQDDEEQQQEQNNQQGDNSDKLKQTHQVVRQLSRISSISEEQAEYMSKHVDCEIPSQLEKMQVFLVQIGETYGIPDHTAKRIISKLQRKNTTTNSFRKIFSGFSYPQASAQLKSEPIAESQTPQEAQREDNSSCTTKQADLFRETEQQHQYGGTRVAINEAGPQYNIAQTVGQPLKEEYRELANSKKEKILENSIQIAQLMQNNKRITLYSLALDFYKEKRRQKWLTARASKEAQGQCAAQSDQDLASCLPLFAQRVKKHNPPDQQQNLFEKGQRVPQGKLTGQPLGEARVGKAGGFKQKKPSVQQIPAPSAAAQEEEEEEIQQPILPNYLQYSAFFIIPPFNYIRLQFSKVISSSWFEGIILLLILYSSILLAIDNKQVQEGSQKKKFLQINDQILTVVFVFEMALKMIAMGVAVHPGAYLRSGWNILDAFIVATSVSSLCVPDNDSLSIFRTFRLVRTLRPLRMISRFKGMQLVVTALLRSLPSVMNVIIFGIFEFGIFAILGVQLFKGKMYKCNDVEIDGVPVQLKEDCVENETFVCTVSDSCPEVGQLAVRKWTNSFLNFDSTGNAMLSLFVVSTLDDFMQLARECMAATDVDQQPVLNRRPIMGLYVISFVFLGGFFWVNLMVSVVIDHYISLINEGSDQALITEAQKKWMDVLRLGEAKVVKQKVLPNNPIRRVATIIIHNPFFEQFIMLCIVLNVLSMAMVHKGQSQNYEDILKIINKAFSSVFIAEAVLKVLVLKPLPYIKDNWNKLDLFIVVLSLPDFFDLTIGGDVFRTLRIGRMFKLVSAAKGLRTVFNTLLVSFPAIFNVGSLLFLLMFVYGVLGMNLFGDPQSVIGQFPHANFNQFDSALLTLFRVFTGDGWSELLIAAAGCDEYGIKCDSSININIAIAYFVSFVVIASFVMLNLIIAVIINNFVENAATEGLLQENNFLDILQRMMVLDRFTKSLRQKLLLYRLRATKGHRPPPSIVRLYMKKKVYNSMSKQVSSATNRGKSYFIMQPKLGNADLVQDLGAKL